MTIYIYLLKNNVSKDIQTLELTTYMYLLKNSPVVSLAEEELEKSAWNAKDSEVSVLLHELCVVADPGLLSLDFWKFSKGLLEPKLGSKLTLPKAS